MPLIIALLIQLSLIRCVYTNNTLFIELNIRFPTQDPTIRAVSINITSIDKRSLTALAKVNRYAIITILKPSRDLPYFLQEALEKQMIARGFMINAKANVNLQIALNNLHADIQEGSLRHNITVNVAISLVAMHRIALPVRVRTPMRVAIMNKGLLMLVTKKLLMLLMKC
ncbi:MAG: YajG family lipoprotein [Arsenophonus sp. NC-QC1-MAG3]